MVQSAEESFGAATVVAFFTFIGLWTGKKVNPQDKKSIKHTIKRIGITKDSVILWGSGEPYREFLYVNDLAYACMFLMENYNYKEIGEFVNVGTGEEIKIKDLASLLKEIVGFDGKISHDFARPDGTPRKLLDISRIRKLG